MFKLKDENKLFFRLPQKSILGFKILSSLHSTISAYFLLFSGLLLRPYFGNTYDQMLSGSIFNIILNLSLIILIFNLIDKRKQLKKINFFLINIILFSFIPQIFFQLFINLKIFKNLLF